jgi:pentose-5-phosphate-3-epimerase
MGADIVVSGSAIFNGDDVGANVARMQEALSQATPPASDAREGIE